MEFISIGGDCQPAEHIRRINPSAEKHFFDSLVTPARTVIRLIETNFHRFLDAADFEAKPVSDGVHVLDKFNNVLVMHDFKTLEPDDVAKAKGKYAYLATKFMKTLQTGRAICFVRRWHSVDGQDGEDAARQLLQLLQRYNPAASLLYLHQDAQRAMLIERDFRAGYIRQVDGDWRGDEAAWTYYLTDCFDDVARLTAGADLQSSGGENDAAGGLDKAARSGAAGQGMLNPPGFCLTGQDSDVFAPLPGHDDTERLRQTVTALRVSAA